MNCWKPTKGLAANGQGAGKHGASLGGLKYKLPLPLRTRQGTTKSKTNCRLLQQEQPGKGAVLHTQTSRVIFIYFYCTHLSLHISWDEANFPSQDKLFLLNSAKSICSQDNFCCCLTQIFWKSKSSSQTPNPFPKLLDCSECSVGALANKTDLFLPAKLLRSPGAQVSWSKPPLQSTWNACTSSPPAFDKAHTWHRSLSSIHVLISGSLATTSLVPSGIWNEHTRGELISGWLSGASAKHQPPRALFPLGAWCRMTDPSRLGTHVCITESLEDICTDS